jgi:hypothetical protein
MSAYDDRRQYMPLAGNTIQAHRMNSTFSHLGQTDNAGFEWPRRITLQMNSAMGKYGHHLTLGQCPQSLAKG